MANTLTNLAADMFKAADIIGREQVGFIPSIKVNAGADGQAVGQTVRSHVTAQGTLINSTPSMTIPEGADQTVTNETLTLTEQKSYQIPWTGEDKLFVNNGSGYESILGDQIAQGMRTLTNAIETDIATDIYKNASRAVGIAGTTPFASDFDLVAEATQILRDNGAPQDNRQTLVLNTLAGTKLRNLASLQKANEAGSDALLRQGTLLDLQGCMLKESGQVQAHTKGTGTSYLVNSAALAIGDTVIPADGGTGTIVAGDIVTFAGDTNKYVVVSALAGGSFTIGGNGLRVAIADNAAITVGNNFTANVLVHQDAYELAVRPAANADDGASDRMTVQDPHSGLVYSVALYKGYQKQMIDISMVWGYKAWKKDFIATVMG